MAPSTSPADSSTQLRAATCSALAAGCSQLSQRCSFLVLGGHGIPQLLVTVQLADIHSKLKPGNENKHAKQGWVSALTSSPKLSHSNQEQQATEQHSGLATHTAGVSSTYVCTAVGATTPPTCCACCPHSCTSSNSCCSISLSVSGTGPAPSPPCCRALMRLKLLAVLRTVLHEGRYKRDEGSERRAVRPCMGGGDTCNKAVARRLRVASKAGPQAVADRQASNGAQPDWRHAHVEERR